VVVVGLHVGILLGHLLERPPPQVVAVGQHVRLGHQREHLPLGVVPLRVYSNAQRMQRSQPLRV
jgi:hypothetical protein